MKVVINVTQNDINDVELAVEAIEIAIKRAFHEIGIPKSRVYWPISHCDLEIGLDGDNHYDTEILVPEHEEFDRVRAFKYEVECMIEEGILPKSYNNKSSHDLMRELFHLRPFSFSVEITEKALQMCRANR
jgi:hypothetical protein